MHNKLYLFKGNYMMSFGRCTHPWKCCHNEHSEHFHHPRNFMCFFASIPPSTPGNWSGILYLWNHMECALFYLASFSIMILRFMYVVTSIGDLFHFIAEWYSVAVPQFVYILPYWWTSELFPILCYSELFNLERVLIFSYVFL